MKRRTRPALGVLGMGLAWALAGCGGDDAEDLASGLGGGGATASGGAASSDARAGIDPQETKAAILSNVVKLIESAALAPPPPPGSPSHFGMAASNLNYYFEGDPDSLFAMPPGAREYLLARIKENGVRSLEARKYTDRDARHIEDCLLYHSIAARVAGEGDDLTRVGRVFDWVVRQIELVPPGSLVPKGFPQAQARPYDVLIRGLASELEDGDWAERSWVFLALCRQLNLDAGMLVLTRRHDTGQPARWLSVVLVDGKPYLFDARIGLPVPGPGGKGVATLDEAANDPEILARLDLPGLSPYPITRDDLTDGVQVLIDSSNGYFSSRMRALQDRLAARNRMTLYRDPEAQGEAFRKAIGPRLKAVELWPVPLMVEFRLFNDPAFNQASQYPLQLFDANRFGQLIRARLLQLRGQIDGEGGAILGYVEFRFEETLGSPDPRNPKKRVPIIPEIRRSLDLYATQFLALCHLDRGRPDQAKFLLEQALAMAAKPGRGALDPPIRWGALANLARLAEDRGDARAAIGYYAEDDPTGQRHGNLLRARDLLWLDPMGPPVSQASAPSPISSASEAPTPTAATR